MHKMSLEYLVILQIKNLLESKTDRATSKGLRSHLESLPLARINNLIFIKGRVYNGLNSLWILYIKNPTWWLSETGRKLIHYITKWKSLMVFNSLRPHRLYYTVHGILQNTGVGSLSLLQGIFPTQGSNQGLPCCRWILYQLSHKGSPLY